MCACRDEVLSVDGSLTSNNPCGQGPRNVEPIFYVGSEKGKAYY